MDGTDLLVNLAFALAAALVGALVAARLGQSIILGYILAGIAISPFTPGPVGDVAAVEALSQIGIVFLMFAIGVQFSFRDLLRVGTVATVGGTVQVLATIGLGYLAGTALGWTPLEALFFGAVISNSSSTVLSKTLGDRGEADSEHGRIGLAWSSIQDIGTIVLVVVLATLAAGGEEIATDVVWAIVQAAVFLTLLILLGSRALPWLFEKVTALQNREVFVLTVVAVALSMAYVSSLFGLSLALGAFVAGMVVSESDLSHQILGELMPLRDIFAGLFFVSVGMLVDPMFVAENIILVLVTLALIVLVKGALTAAIVAIMRRSARTALLTGVTLAQSAEFSFLLARLGTDLGVVSPAVFSLMLAGAAISIALSPTLHQIAGPLIGKLETRLPLSDLAAHPALDDNPKNGPRGHAIICGYGRVGRMLGFALRRRQFPYVVIDQDQRVVQRLRERGTTALLGNAANPIILDRVGLDRARVLVVALPDAVVARQIVDYARNANPNVDIVVRTHSDGERDFLHDRGVNEAVVGEIELALEMTRHTLRRFGLSALETQTILQGLRARSAREGRSGERDQPD
jgi:monovalent cation:H+ antiporter-2, CPA2 family